MSSTLITGITQRCRIIKESTHKKGGEPVPEPAQAGGRTSCLKLIRTPSRGRYSTQSPRVLLPRYKYRLSTSALTTPQFAGTTKQIVARQESLSNVLTFLKNWGSCEAPGCTRVSIFGLHLTSASTRTILARITNSIPEASSG